MLSLHAPRVLTRLCCKGYSFVLSCYISRIGSPLCSTSANGTPLVSFCYGLTWVAHSLAISFLLTTTGSSLWQLPNLCGNMVCRRTSIFRKGSGKNNNTREISKSKLGILCLPAGHSLCTSAIKTQFFLLTSF